jgi:nucleotide-binding universal stress UspA family protein
VAGSLLFYTPFNATGGAMFRDILIIFDNQKSCPEALDYGREFALRMDARVTFLMLVPMSFRGKAVLRARRIALNRIEDRAAKLLSRVGESFIQQGMEISSAFRVGEPAEEVLKFLADHPPFQAIIWGSGPDLPGKGHWLSRIYGHIECPLLTVSRKRPPKQNEDRYGGQ